MGYRRHHAIIVTSWNDSLLIEAHTKALKIFPYVSDILPGMVNNYGSFFMPPDGSNEGWAHSGTGDERRKEFIEWIDKQRHEDNSTDLQWVEVQYGDDEGDNKVTRHNDEKILI